MKRREIGGDRAVVEWVYDDLENSARVRRVDIFFAVDDQGFAVLGTAPPARFGDSLPLFRDVAGMYGTFRMGMYRLLMGLPLAGGGDW